MFENMDNEKRYKLNARRAIFGYTSMDGTIGKPYYIDIGGYPKNDTEYKQYLEAYFGTSNNDERMIYDLMTKYYPKSDFGNNVSVAFWTMNGDVCVACPTFEIGDYLYDIDNFELFIYEFRGPYSPFIAPHASELVWLFVKPNLADYFDMRYNSTLSDQIISAWTQFASYSYSYNYSYNYNYGGNGNRYGSDDNDDVITFGDGMNENYEWFGYNKNDNKTIFIFDNNIRNVGKYVDTYNNGACNFWKNVSYSIKFEFCNNLRGIKDQ